MRYIPTTAAAVAVMKKQAKRLQAQRGGKRAENLDRVARIAGYDHWHHVTLCLASGTNDETIAALEAECQLVLDAASAGVTKIILTGPELLAQPLVLFSARGDAWMLEPTEGLQSCLRFGGEVQASSFASRNGRAEIAWDGTFELEGAFFRVESGHPAIGVQVIGGYPLDLVREAIDRGSPERRYEDVFGQGDARELTSEFIEELVLQGWKRDQLEEGAGRGMRYLPSRDSLVLTPQHGS
jgi:hypothetical protein